MSELGERWAIVWAAALATMTSVAYALAKLGPATDSRSPMLVGAALGSLGVFIALKNRPVLAYLAVLALGLGLQVTVTHLLAFVVPGWLLYVVGYHLGRRARLAPALMTMTAASIVNLATYTWLNLRTLEVMNFPGEVRASFSLAQMILDLVPSTLTGIVLPVLVGVAVRSQGERLELSRQLLAQQRLAQQAAVDRAIRGDRQRMAHELHDLAAHHTTAAVINAKAARKLAERDPAKARELLDGIVEQSQTAQLSMRQIVGLLTSDELAPLEPQPSLGEIVPLVEQNRTINPDIVCEFEPMDVSTAVALAAYRIVQESLTNAHRHAPGAPVTVLLGPDEGAEHLLVEVRNGEPTRPAEPELGTGHGIEGMRLRAEALGGSLEAGEYGRGWRVLAELPARPGLPGGEQDGRGAL